MRKFLGIETLIITPEPKKDLTYLLANRHYFSSINPGDFDEYLLTTTESERKEYEAQASIIFNNSVFKREIKHLFALQSLFISNECENWEQSLLGRGTTNGIGLVEDRLQLLNARHLQNIAKPEADVDNSPL